MKISLFKKIKLFKSYKKAIKNNLNELNSKFFIRKDKADRLYTVLNIPEELIGDAYSIKKSDIDKITENYIKQYLKELRTDLDSCGLKELYIPYKIERVGKYSYLIVIGFSLFKSNKYYNTIYYAVTPFLLLSLLSLFLFVF